jgi:thiamine-monophosphate kinase
LEELRSNKTLGERKIIELIFKQLEQMPQMPVPFGDDVSAYPLGKDKLAILKTDMLVGKTDVPPGMSLWQASRKAVIINISDFAAKGVKPLVLLASLGLPENLTLAEITEIGKGLNAGAREYGAFIVGGDTNEASDLIISLSLFGIAEKSKMMLRSGARVGDLVAVTGFFGKTAAGLKILLEGIKIENKIRNILIDSVMAPHARLKEGLALSETDAVTASIDSSDGLAWSLYEIARSSEVGFLIKQLPVAEEVKNFAEHIGMDPLELALYGGEEYELVITVKPELMDVAEEAVAKVGGKLIVIGKVISEKAVYLEAKGRRYTVEPKGWEHFKSNNV